MDRESGSDHPVKASMQTIGLSGREMLIAFLCLVGAGVAVFANSLAGPFVFDDGPAIVENPSIRQLWPINAVLHPAIDGGATVSGRPLVNLSFALNHAVSGYAVRGYHVTNLIIHLLGGLLLWGILRRSFHQPIVAGRYGKVALPLSLALAMIWLLHPLQTGAVTYIVQRAESLAGFWYLLTLYGFIKSARMTKGGRWWLLGSVLACLLGMATKEIMVTAPLVVLLYDRTFVAGSFQAAWRQRRGYYLGLASTWLLLAVLVASTAGRGGTAGFNTSVSSWSYFLTQSEAIARYLRLVIWPDPLVFDYGTATVARIAQVWPELLFLGALGLGTIWALGRKPVWGFAGAVFFLLLAPSSSFVPVASQTMAEHRMYLALIIPVLLIVLGLHRLIGQWSYVVFSVVVLGCGWLTMERNEDYRTVERLWSDTVAKRPSNGRAHHELGKVFLEQGNYPEAMGRFQTAIRLQPLAMEPRYNLGIALVRQNRGEEAVAEYREALRLQPNAAEVHNNLAIALMHLGRLNEAEAQFQEGLRHHPDYAMGQSNLANFYLIHGRPTEAIAPARTAVRLNPNLVAARANLGSALAETGQLHAAAEEFAAVLRLQPDHDEAHYNLGNVMLEFDRVAEAIQHYEAALKANPGYFEPRRNLAFVLAQLGRKFEAIRHLEILRQLRPGDAEIRKKLRQLQGPGLR